MREQAENFIATVGDLSGHLPPVVDLELSTAEVNEPPAKETIVSALKSYLAILEEEYGGRPILYSREDFYKEYLEDDFSEYPRWVSSVYYPVYIESGDNWVFWQYNDRGTFPHYSGEKYIDLDVLNRNYNLSDLVLK